MAIAFSNLNRFKAGNVWINTVRGSITGAYSAGETFNASNAGLQQVINVISGSFSNGFPASYDACNGKIKAYKADGNEVSASETIGGTAGATIDLIVFGR